MATIDELNKHRDFNLNDPLPSPFVDAISAALGSYVSPNFALTIPSGTPNSLQVVADALDQQVAVSIDGSLRVNIATVTATHPGGAAGWYDVFVTSRVLNETAEDGGTFDYSFGLAILASGGTPANTVNTAIHRKVGVCAWDGTRIVDAQCAFHANGHAPFGADMHLGHVVEWYRANANVPVPRGFAVCDGTAWGAIVNDMGLSTGNIPNLVDRFTLGVPLGRIGETGGVATHNLAHDHGGVTGGRAPGTDAQGSHSHGHNLGTADASAGPRSGAASSVGADPMSLARHVHAVTGGLYNDGSHSHNVNNHDHPISSNLSAATDNRPPYYGLVKLMKVRHIR